MRLASSLTTASAAASGIGRERHVPEGADDAGTDAQLVLDHARPGGAAPQVGADPRDELVEADRLRQEVVGPGLESLDDAAIRSGPGHQQDRQRGGLGPRTKHLDERRRPRSRAAPCRARGRRPVAPARISRAASPVAASRTSMSFRRRASPSSRRRSSWSSTTRTVPDGRSIRSRGTCGRSSTHAVRRQAALGRALDGIEQVARG